MGEIARGLLQSVIGRRFRVMALSRDTARRVKGGVARVALSGTTGRAPHPTRAHHRVASVSRSGTTLTPLNSSNSAATVRIVQPLVHGGAPACSKSSGDGRTV
jgi:hypothetical protein